MKYFAQKELLTLITCNCLTNRPTDFKTTGVCYSAFCISIQKKKELNVNKIIVVTMIY